MEQIPLNRVEFYEGNQLFFSRKIHIILIRISPFFHHLFYSSRLSPGMPRVVLLLAAAGKPLEGRAGIVYSAAHSPDGGSAQLLSLLLEIAPL